MPGEGLSRSCPSFQEGMGALEAQQVANPPPADLEQLIAAPSSQHLSMIFDSISCTICIDMTRPS